MSRILRPEAAAPLGGKIWNRWTGTLALFVLLMLVVLAFRFARGLGAVTNLNDGYPWGIWIAFDDVVGSGFGAGGFTVAFIVYILNRGEYHPIVRPAILTAFFGYASIGASVFFDIGRYWDFWHIFVPKYAQLNSAMLELAVCLTAYLLVAFIELTPVILERLGWQRARRKMESLLFLVIALGTVLPMMQQSALGSLLVIFGPQIHPLYQTQLLPLLFLASCIGMGLAGVVLEGTLSAIGFKRPLERHLLGKLAGVAQIVTALWLVARFVDVAWRGVFGELFTASTVSLMFWIETLLFAAPLVVLWSKEARQSPQNLFVGAALLALGGVLYRIDAYLVAYDTGAGWHYFPSLGEITVTVGLIAFEILAFIIAVRLLPVLPKPQPSR